MLFDDDGSVKPSVDPRTVAKKNRIQSIISDNDGQIKLVLEQNGFESLSDLKERIRSDISNHKKQRGMIEVVEYAMDRSDRYVDDMVHGIESDIPFFDLMNRALMNGSTPLFGGGKTKNVYSRIWVILNDEQKKLKAVTTFL